MATKVSWIASWVLVRSLSWTQCKKWIPIRLMGCVHTHWEMPTIEGWGNPIHIQSVVKKNGENNWKAQKIGQAISQTLTPELKHDKIQAQWASNVPLKSMLEKVWQCKRSKMESWSWIICCPRSCSNGGRHARAKSGRRSHVPWSVARKEMSCYWLVLRLQKGRDVDQP
jgi:hypothetical protein